MLRRVILDGFSEFLTFPRDARGRRQPAPLRSTHAVSALKEREFVTAEIQDLCAIGAVGDVTHLAHDPREVCYTLGLLVAERNG